MSNEYTYTDPMPAHRFIERHLIHLMVDELHAAGWAIFSYNDGDEDIDFLQNHAKTVKEEVWEAYLAVDEIRFFVTNGERHGWIYLVGGNGEDVISDYTIKLESVMRKVYLR